jgi:hypothetical protein
MRTGEFDKFVWNEFERAQHGPERREGRRAGGPE